MLMASTDSASCAHDFHEWLGVLEETLEQLPVTNENYRTESRALEQAIAELYSIIEHYEQTVEKR